MVNLKLPHEVENFLDKNSIYIYDTKLEHNKDLNLLTFYVASNVGIIDVSLCYDLHKLMLEIFPKDETLKKYFVSEVCSIGMNRVVKNDLHLQKSLNQYVKVNLLKAINNEYVYYGNLLSFDKNQIEITQNRKENLLIQRDWIKKIIWQE